MADSKKQQFDTTLTKEKGMRKSIFPLSIHSF